MSLVLLKHLFKKNWKLWAAITALLSAYLLIIAAVAQDELMRATVEFLGLPAEDSASAVVASVFYGLVLFIFSMIYYIITAHSLVHKPADNSSLSCYLTVPLSRNKFIATCGVYLAAAMFAQFVIIFGVGSLGLLIHGPFDVANFALMHLVMFLCVLSVAFISFSVSVVGTGSGWGRTVSAGIPIFLVFLLLISQMVPALGNASYATPFGWVNPVELVIGTATAWWIWSAIYAAVTAALFALSIAVFNKKQLSI